MAGPAAGPLPREQPHPVLGRQKRGRGEGRLRGGRGGPVRGHPQREPKNAATRERALYIAKYVNRQTNLAATEKAPAA